MIKNIYLDVFKKEMKSKFLGIYEYKKKKKKQSRIVKENQGYTFMHVYTESFLKISLNFFAGFNKISLVLIHKK